MNTDYIVQQKSNLFAIELTEIKHIFYQTNKKTIWQLLRIDNSNLMNPSDRFNIHYSTKKGWLEINELKSCSSWRFGLMIHHISLRNRTLSSVFLFLCISGFSFRLSMRVFYLTFQFVSLFLGLTVGLIWHFLKLLSPFDWLCNCFTIFCLFSVCVSVLDFLFVCSYFLSLFVSSVCFSLKRQE